MPATAANESCQPGSRQARGLSASVTAAASSSAYQREAGRDSGDRRDAGGAHHAGPLERRARAGERDVDGDQASSAATAPAARAGQRPAAAARARRAASRSGRTPRGDARARCRGSLRDALVDRLVLAEDHPPEQGGVGRREARRPRRARRERACASSAPASPPRRRPVRRAPSRRSSPASPGAAGRRRSRTRTHRGRRRRSALRTRRRLRTRSGFAARRQRLQPALQMELLADPGRARERCPPGRPDEQPGTAKRPARHRDLGRGAEGTRAGRGQQVSAQLGALTVRDAFGLRVNRGEPELAGGRAAQQQRGGDRTERRGPQRGEERQARRPPLRP